MTVSLTKIANNTASVSFQVGETPDEVLDLTYYPGRVTEKIFLSMMSFSKLTTDNAAAGFEEFNATLVTLIKDWDLYEDDAQTQKFPLDASRFPDLPISFRMQVVQAITSDMRPESGATQSLSNS